MFEYKIIRGVIQDSPIVKGDTLESRINKLAKENWEPISLAYSEFHNGICLLKRKTGD